MKKYPVIIAMIALLALAAASGCDSGGDSPAGPGSNADVNGTWRFYFGCRIADYEVTRNSTSLAMESTACITDPANTGMGKSATGSIQGGNLSASMLWRTFSMGGGNWGNCSVNIAGTVNGDTMSGTWAFDPNGTWEVPECDLLGSGTWTATRQDTCPKMAVGSLAHESGTYKACGAGAPDTMILTGDPAWTDYTLTTDVLAQYGTGIWLLFRVQDEDNCYVFRIAYQGGGPTATLGKMVGGTYQAILEQPMPAYQPGTWLNLSIGVSGNHLKALADGVSLLEADDATFAAGSVGLGTCYAGYIFFDNVTVEDQAGALLFADDFADGCIKGWWTIHDDASLMPACCNTWYVWG